jgi:hypothetical protein
VAADSGGQQLDVLMNRDHSNWLPHLLDVLTRLLRNRRLDRSDCATYVELTGNRVPPDILLLICMHLVLRIIFKREAETAR